MPFASIPNAELYYEDVGEGPVIITTHGVNENTLYWSLPGITDRLVQAGYRVVSTDMRAHGRTRCTGVDRGYDVTTIADDFGRVADHLGVDRFHLLTHATGGMAGVDYAIRNHQRLLSLMSTDTGSQTAPALPREEIIGDPDATFDRIDPTAHPLINAMLAGLRSRDPDNRVVLPRQAMDQDVFLNRLHLAKHTEAAYTQLECVLSMSIPAQIIEFMSSFYDDPDPKVSGLRQISCPCLVLLGGHDVLFLRPSELMAREIPNATHVVMAELGHMTAIEDPDWLALELLSFLEKIQTSGSGDA